MGSSTEETLERLYQLIGWVEDLSSPEGRRRFDRYLRLLPDLLAHPWIAALLQRELRIADVCAGTGLGGIALAKLLAVRGLRCRLTLVDLRSSALDKAKQFAAQEIPGVEVETLKHDVARLHELNRCFDLVLMFGASAAHFNPWQFLGVLTAIAYCLSDDGVLVLEEPDRRYTIAVRGYRIVMPEKGTDFGISVHRGYDFRRGTFIRAYVDLLNPSQRVVYPICFWGVAELAAFCWCFFHNVDLLPCNRSNTFFVIAQSPRRLLTPELFAELPRAVRSEQ